MGSPLFDAYVMVDWSASNVRKRGADSIWSAVLHRTSGELDVVNHPTRTGAKEMLRTLLRSAVTAGDRVLVGFDMPYGYPVGTAVALGLETRADLPTWRAMWEEVNRLVDDDLDGVPNRNNRFAAAADLNARLGVTGIDRAGPGPFWGCPVQRASGPLSPKKLHAFPYSTSTGALSEFRHSERALQARRLRPFSVWQLLGAGAVGSQVLTGIPILLDLVADPMLAGHSHVWPFTTGLSLDVLVGIRGRADAPGYVVHAEIWPGFLPSEDVAAVDHPVKDARQVVALVRWADAHDRAGTLAALFAPELAPEIAAEVVTEEGWVVGVSGPAS